MADPAQREGGEPIHCTGLSAAWCPRCGKCTCDRAVNMDNPDCPLHGDDSHHAERNPEPLSCPHTPEWKARLRQAALRAIEECGKYGVTLNVEGEIKVHEAYEKFVRILHEGE